MVGVISEETLIKEGLIARKAPRTSNPAPSRAFRRRRHWRFSPPFPSSKWRHLKKPNHLPCSLFQRSRRLTGPDQGNPRSLQLLKAADILEVPKREALSRGVPCAFLRHIGSGEPLGSLLLSDARGGAASNLCALVQSHHWLPCEACETGVWRAVHQAAAWFPMSTT